jgi:hypothetical protein
MPDETIALEHYHRLRADRYPHTVDTPAEARPTW